MRLLYIMLLILSIGILLLYGDDTIIDIDDIIDLHLAWLDNDFDDIINATDYIAQAKYDLGYHDAFENL